MNKKSLWDRYVSSWLWMDVIRHGFTALICAVALPFTLYFTFAPLDPPGAGTTAVRGTIERAQVAPCFTREQTIIRGRQCIDAVSVSYRNQGGLLQTAVFRLPGDPPFNAAQFPAGATLDLLTSTEDLNTAFNQTPYAVAVNGAVLKPLKDERLVTRVLLFFSSIVLVLVLASGVGRLVMHFDEKARANARAKAGA